MKNENLKNLPIEVVKIAESLRGKQQEIFLKRYNELKLKRPFVYFCLFFGFSHYFYLGRPLFTWLGLITAITIPYSLNLLILVDLFRLPKMIRKRNEDLANTIAEKIKQTRGDFDVRDITTASYNFKEIFTHVLFDFPKKTKPVILGFKERVLFAVIWLSLLSALVSGANKVSTKEAKSVFKSVEKLSEIAKCDDPEVIKYAKEFWVKRVAEDPKYMIPNFKELEKGRERYVTAESFQKFREEDFDPKLNVRKCAARFLYGNDSDTPHEFYYNLKSYNRIEMR